MLSIPDFLKRRSRHLDLRLRRFSVTYRIEAFNGQPHAKQCTIVAPLPPNTQRQTLPDEVAFETLPSGQGTDSVFENKYAWWDITIPPGAPYRTQYQFDIVTRPQKEGTRSRSAGANDCTEKQLTNFTTERPHIQANDVRIRALANKLTRKRQGAADTVGALNHYIVRHLSYGKPIPGLYSAVDAVTLPSVDCGGFVSLLTALCIARGI